VIRETKRRKDEKFIAFNLLVFSTFLLYKMFAKVIPAVKLPRNLGAFDYAIPERYRAFVRRGSWVMIPWRNRPTDGLVVDVTEKADVKASAVKEILGFGDLHPLDESLTRLPEWMAGRYFAAAATALKAFLPRTPKTMVLTEHDGTKERKHESATVKARKMVLRYSNPAEKAAELIRLVRETTDAGRSAVIVTPHSNEVDIVADLISADSADVPVIRFIGRISEAKLRRNWKTLLASSGPTIVIGTRPAIFAPVPDPGLFLVLESDSADLRQYDQNPRYDAREIALQRAESSGADIVYMAHAPRLEEYALTVPDGFDFIDSQGIEGSESLGVSLVNVSGNPLGRDNPLSPVAVSRIEDALQRGKKVLIFLNRRGSAGALACGDCGEVFRCGRCGIAESFSGEILQCRRCEATRAVPGRCGRCGGLKMRPVGSGTVSVVDALQRSFPNAKIHRHDSECAPAGGGCLPENADIYVGTRLLLHDAAELDMGTGWGCVIAVDADSLLAHPGFRVMEDAWRAVRVMRDIAKTSGADILLQTVDPENAKLRRLLEDSDAFMKEELEYRKKSGYPPSGTLITVTARESNEAEAERVAQEFRTKAERAAAGGGAQVAGPLKPKRPFRDGRWHRAVAIKTPAQVPAAIRELLGSLPEDHIIDRNPESI